MVTSQASSLALLRFCYIRRCLGRAAGWGKIGASGAEGPNSAKPLEPRDWSLVGAWEPRRRLAHQRTSSDDPTGSMPQCPHGSSSHHVVTNRILLPSCCASLPHATLPLAAPLVSGHFHLLCSTCTCTLTSHPPATAATAIFAARSA